MSNKSDKSVEANTPEFSGWRNYFWPVHNQELKKFLPMCFLLMFILFNYTLMRDTKDVLVIAAEGSGAEVVSFLKLAGVLPSAFIFMFFYVKMANKMSGERIFYTLITFFMLFFAFFGFILNPLAPKLHMSFETLTSLRETLPKFLHWPIAAVGNWGFSLFYIMAELWGSVVISMLFWQFANSITKVNESKRFYAFFGLIGNLGLILSARVLRFGSKVGEWSKAAGNGDGYVDNLRVLTAFIILSCLIIMCIYYLMQKKVLTDPNLFDPNLIKEKKKKPKLSLIESFKYIFTSPYLGLLLIIVLGYNICINLVELVWKSQVKIAFPDKNDYSRFMSVLSESTGYFTILFTLIGVNILRKCKWRTAALITPFIVLLTSIVFFYLLSYSRVNDPHTLVNLKFLTTTIVMLTVSVGLVQNVACKGTKYSLFDSTKQMAYIPLDSELKTKGQAAVEVIGGRFGKSGGAMIQAILLGIYGGGTTLLSLSWLLGPMVIFIAIMWILAVFGLNKKFTALTSKTEQ